MGGKECATCGSVQAQGAEACPDCGGVEWAGEGGDKTDRAVVANLAPRAGEDVSEYEEADSLSVWKGAGAGMLTGVAFGLGGFFTMHDGRGLKSISSAPICVHPRLNRPAT